MLEEFDLPVGPGHLPRPERSRSAAEQAKLAGRMRWDHELAVRDHERQRTKITAEAEIGELTDRELLLIGVGLYWAEGTKDKPYDRRENLTFVNSDPGMIKTYLAWLAGLGVTRDRIGFRVMIHQTADVMAAERYWAELVGIEASALRKTTLKKHNPRTTRKNTGESYHGCLVIRVSQGAELYRRVEGWWRGIVEQAQLHLR